jgi:hypothetical protein
MLFEYYGDVWLAEAEIGDCHQVSLFPASSGCKLTALPSKGFEQEYDN